MLFITPFESTLHFLNSAAIPSQEKSFRLSFIMNQTKIIFLIVLLAVAAIAANWQRFQNKTTPPIVQNGSPMTATVSDFSGSMDEAAVLRKAAIPLKCINDASALPLGDRVCYSNISSYAGITAIRVAFFFKEGLLSNLKIDVPGPLHRVMSATLAVVQLTECTRPLSASTPICAFIPKCH